MLINSYCQSLGNPIQQNLSISDSLVDLAQKCANKFLINAITSKVKDCAIPVHRSTLSNSKQIRCLIYYDINKQLCSAVSASKLTLADEYKIEKNDVDKLCTLAKGWNFTSFSEKVFKSSTICGEICGSEEVGEANDFCNYYKWGNEILTAQVLTPNKNVDKNVIESPVITESESNSKGDIAVPVNNNQVSQQKSTKIPEVPSKQDIIDAPKSASDNINEVADVAVSKSTDQTTSSKQPSSGGSETNIEKNDGVAINVDAPKPAVDVPEIDTVNQGNKSTMNSELKPDAQNDPLLPAKDVINIDQKDAVLENNDGKVANDPDEYVDPDANDDTDDDGDDQASNIKLPEKQESIVQPKLPSQNGDSPQKVSDFYPSSDGFSDDGDHFFQFFLTAVILIVLLYVLYHNKNKVSKVFFGLILEGRQDSRRRNSRGHAYRRLDTLEQAMSAKTAAPPSKIIY